MKTSIPTASPPWTETLLPVPRSTHSMAEQQDSPVPGVGSFGVKSVALSFVSEPGGQRSIERGAKTSRAGLPSPETHDVGP